MNTKLLNQVAEAILDEPRKFNMDSYVRQDETSPCGTVACIGGWAVALGDQLSLKELDAFDMEDLFAVSRRAYEIIDDVNVYKLLHVMDWPISFRKAYERTLSREDRADIAFWRIRCGLREPPNPRFLEWLMAWPIEWTAIEPLETDKFRQWLRSHGEPSQHSQLSP